MFNTGIGPIINKKTHRQNQPQKRSVPPGYPPYDRMKMPQQNQPGPMQQQMGMGMNPMNAPKPRDMSQMPQQNPNAMRMEGPPHHQQMQYAKQQQQQQQQHSQPQQHPPHQQQQQMQQHQQQQQQQQQQQPQMPPQQQQQQQPLPQPQLQPNPSIASSGVSNVSSPAPTPAQPKAVPKTTEKEKPSEMATNILKVGPTKFKQKILTKILFGKKQIIWEIIETPKNSGDDDSKPSTKRKFEIKFADIEKIDINPDSSNFHIYCKEKPKEFKDLNPQPKKSANWTKADGDTNLGDDNKMVIYATFAKELLTKSSAGKPSHLDKIKKCDLPLYIQGNKYEPMSIPSTPNNKEGFPFTQGEFSVPQTPSQMAIEHGNPQKISFPPNIPQSSSENSKQNKNDGKIIPEDPAAGDDDDDDEKEFPPLTKEQKLAAKIFEQDLKKRTDQDKIDNVLETIKPKKFGFSIINQSKKIMKCPIYKCSATKSTPALLKTHLQKAHKKLVELGFSVSDEGLFTWKPELFNYVLMVSKVYPKFVRNLLREQKKN